MGDRVFGTLGSDEVSQYQIGDDWVQISMNGNLYRVTPIDFGSLFNYFVTRTTPGYVLVDCNSGEAKLVRYEGLKYMKSAYFSHDLYRRFFFADPCAQYGSAKFELDDEGKPYWIVQTAEGVLQTRAVVNAAGVYSDILHNMVSADKIRIVPRKGDYLLLDRRTGGYVQHTVFQVPGKFGKGVLVSPTVHGNTIIGPTAEDIEDKEGVDTTAEGFDDLMEKAGLAFDDLPLREVITSFAGLRAHEARHDFILGEASDAPGFFDCAGIESPGLTAAPAIGKEIAAQLAEKLGLAEDPDFVGTRKGFIDPKALDLPDLAELIKEKPEYGRIVCRCEQVSEGEIRDAIRRPLGARSLDGVKRRVRAGMGRCQAGFCSPRIMDILAEELGVDVADITKSGGHSEVIVGLVKDRV